MGQKFLFKFITPIQYKELNTLQTKSIYHSINLIQRKQNKIMFLQDDILYHKIEQQLQRFLGCSNYVSNFISRIHITCAPLF